MNYAKIPILLQELFMKKLMILSASFGLLEHDEVLLDATRLCLSIFLIFLQSKSAWNSCFLIFDSQSARICSLCRSRRVLIWSQSEFSL